MRTKAILIGILFLLLSGMLVRLAQAPTETRYFRSDTADVNGLDTEVLGTSQVPFMSWRTKIWLDPELIMTRWYWWIMVWKRSSGGVETPITIIPAALVYRNMVGSGIQSATYTPIETALDPTDTIVVRVYCAYYIPPSMGPPYLLDTWQTEQLGASKLNSTQWTVYYFTALTFDGSWTWKQLFYFDHAALLSRIEGFTWTPYVEPKTWNTIALWTFNLTTRQWNTAVTWSFDLYTRMWNVITDWTFDIWTLGWHTVTTWVFNITTGNIWAVLALILLIGCPVALVLFIVTRKRR